MILFYIIIYLELFIIFYNFIKYLFYIIKNKHKTIPQANIYNKHIFILIPCYQETDTIINTLHYFDKLISNIKNIDLFVITTDKEITKATYNLIASSEIIKSCKLHLINYSNVVGEMAAQLNFAIEYIFNQYDYNDCDIYFSIYNADSNPDKNTFAELNKLTSHNKPLIIQQYSNYFLNYNKLSKIMKGFAIYQTAFEFRNGIINNTISPFLYSHVVGHGLTIRGDIIKRLGYFSTDFWCEDIYMTGLLKNNNIKIDFLSSFDNAENTFHLKDQIIQSGIWFKTTSNHFKILKNIKQKEKINFRGIIWLFHEIRATLEWLFFPMLIFYTLIYPILINNYNLFLYSIIIYALFVFFNYYMNFLIVDFKRFKKYILNFPFTLISILLTNLGPLYSFLLKKKTKTPRA